MKYVSSEQQILLGLSWMRERLSTGSKYTWLRNRSWRLCAYPPGVSFVLFPDWRKSYSMDLLYCQNKISLPVRQTQDLGMEKGVDCLFFQILKWSHWNKRVWWIKHCFLTNKSEKSNRSFCSSFLSWTQIIHKMNKLDGANRKHCGYHWILFLNSKAATN